jgi:uncharacterized protein DUF6153
MSLGPERGFAGRRASVDAVTHRPAADIRRCARWLLLLGTLFGLAAMHTLGHTGMQMVPPTNHAAPAVASIRASVQAYLEPAAEMREAPSCTGDHCPDHGAMSQWSVCLAVLGGLAVFALLVAVLIGGGRTRTPAAGKAMSTPVTSRAPPQQRFGLTIASTAVLRI